MISGIYKITNIITGKIYVGSAVNLNKRFSQHKTKLKYNKHHSSKLQNSYNKHGVSSFEFETIEECVKEKLVEREQHYIDLYDVFNKGYNCSPIAGSPMMNKKHTQKTKNKMSDSRKKVIITDECKKNISLGLLGKKHTKERRNHMSQSMKGNTNCKGRFLSEETKEKIRKGNIGKQLGEKNQMFGKKHSENTKEKMRKSKIGKFSGDKNYFFGKSFSGRNSPLYNPTPILQYDLNDNFIKEWQDLWSTKEAGFDHHHIARACKKQVKTSSGYKWEFKQILA